MIPSQVLGIGVGVVLCAEELADELFASFRNLFTGSFIYAKVGERRNDILFCNNILFPPKSFVLPIDASSGAAATDGMQAY